MYVSQKQMYIEKVGILINRLKVHGNFCSIPNQREHEEQEGRDIRDVRLGIENAGFMALRICLCSFPVTVKRPYPATRPRILRRNVGCRLALVGKAGGIENAYPRVFHPICHQNLVQRFGLRENYPFNAYWAYDADHWSILFDPFALGNTGLAFDDRWGLAEDWISQWRTWNFSER